MIYFFAGKHEDLRKFDGELTTEDDVGEGRRLDHSSSFVGRK
jgi:hypothetical protein